MMGTGLTKDQKAMIKNAERTGKERKSARMRMRIDARQKEIMVCMS